MTADRPTSKRCDNPACAMKDTKITTALTECIGCGRDLKDALDLSDLSDLFDLSGMKGFGK